MSVVAAAMGAAADERILAFWYAFEHKTLSRFPTSLRRAHILCSVRPRYTSGSPASVDFFLAARVAMQEIDGYKQALSGIWGESEKHRAELLGLRGIACVMQERGHGRKMRWHIADLCTDEYYTRPHDSEIERQGWTPFSALPESVRQAIQAAGTGKDSDYTRTFWRQTDRLPTGQVELDWQTYAPELVPAVP